MNVELLCKNYQGMSGLARYVQSLRDGLMALGHTVYCAEPKLPKFMRPLCDFGRKRNLDLTTFLQTYPIAANWQLDAPIRHLTTQEMGMLLLTPQHPRTVVTVHDILPLLLRQQPQLSELNHSAEHFVYRLAMRGLRRATRLIADSDYTKQTLITTLRISPSRIAVVPLAIDHTLFRPRPVPTQFWQRFNLPRNKRIILYVGSDAPRKNLLTLLAAFQQVRQQFGDVLLVKVGATTSAERQRAFTAEVGRQRLTPHVHIFKDVNAVDLVHFYNAADVFAFPSLYEGFGLPPLEAMACGTPTVCSNAASLPEVVGDAARMHDPYNATACADAICSILSNPLLAARLRQQGLQQASNFTWQRTAQATSRVYKTIAAGNQ